MAADALGFYVQKLFVPSPLAIDYGRTPRAVVEQQRYFITCSIAVATVIAAVAPGGGASVAAAGPAPAAIRAAAERSASVRPVASMTAGQWRAGMACAWRHLRTASVLVCSVTNACVRVHTALSKIDEGDFRAWRKGP